MSDLGKEQKQILLFCYVVLGNRFYGTPHTMHRLQFTMLC